MISPEGLTPEQELAEMRRQYQFATLDGHMLVDGKVRLRCRVCKVAPVPEHWMMAQLCDPCLDKRISKRERA